MPNPTSKKQATPTHSAGIFAQGYAVALDNFYTAIKRHGLEDAYALCLHRVGELSQQKTLDDVPAFDAASLEKRRRAM